MPTNMVRKPSRPNELYSGMRMPLTRALGPFSRYHSTAGAAPARSVSVRHARQNSVSRRVMNGEKVPDVIPLLRVVFVVEPLHRRRRILEGVDKAIGERACFHADDLERGGFERLDEAH